MQVSSNLADGRLEVLDLLVERYPSNEVSTALVEDPGGGGGVVDALEELLAGAGGLGVGWNQGQPKQLGF